MSRPCFLKISNPCLLVFVSALMISYSLVSCDKRMISASRPNILQSSYPEDFSQLSVISRKRASDYGIAWGNTYNVLGTSGIANEDLLEKVYSEELLPLIKPLESGTDLEKVTFRAAIKIHDAFFYLGDRLRKQTPFDNPELNALLRYRKGNESNPFELSAGVVEMIFDYFHLVDEERAIVAFERHSRREKFPNAP